MRNIVDYREITVFANKERTKFLVEFRSSIVEYFANVRHSWQAGGPIENDAAIELRPSINERVDRAHRFILGAGIAVQATQMPAPGIGGHPAPFNFLTDLFRLRDFHTTEQPLLDRIDRAIGVYKADLSNALFRTLNPFWWVWRGSVKLTALPFILLNAAGFDASSIEHSLLGKLLKFLVFILTGLASAVAIFEFFDAN